MTDHKHADCDKHTDAQLREAIDKTDEQAPGIEGDQDRKHRGPDALEANREQRDAMADELDQRDDATDPAALGG